MMKKQLHSEGVTEIERLISEIVDDDLRYVRTEMRSTHRDHLVVPVTLLFRDGSKQYTFSRNISTVGICLIGRELIQINRIVDLQMYRLNGQPTSVAAEARWCKPFGKQYFMSGWKFLQVRRQ